MKLKTKVVILLINIFKILILNIINIIKIFNKNNHHII